jgi:exopolyphosphatase/guanosine-5'-triphosphate,3'-diphosphate pyrophosphatase
MIIPRWEWRTFGDGFPAQEAAIKAHECTGTKQSTEQYILSRTSDENVKIRFDLLDVKSFQERNANALEQWKPVYKQGFPIPAAELSTLFREYFKCDAPAFARAEYSFDEFLHEIVSPCGNLTCVDVVKTRHAYTINDTTVEIADVTLGGVAQRTICVEHTCADTVIATVRQLGLAELPNINYIAAMKTAVGGFE